MRGEVRVLEKQEIVAELVQLVSQQEHTLTSEGIMDADPRLFKRARAAFGAWEDALAAALCYAAQGRRRKTSQATATAEDSHQRQRQDNWDAPLILVSQDQRLCQVSAQRVPIQQSAGARPDFIDVEGQPLPLHDLMVATEEGSLVIYSPQGQAWAVDERLVPDGDQTSRAASELAGLASGETVQALLLRRRLRGARRACHVTAQGRIKASDSAELIRAMGRDGAQAFLLAPEDHAVAVFGQEGGQTTVFCAAREGNGIHFKASEVRTMGLRAQGVKAMELGEGDALVGAAAARGKEQVLVLSEQGCGKRVSLEEFRIQGRGGQGMILMRPHLAGDGLAAIHLVGSLDEDVLVLTSRGRLARVAVTAFPLLGRASRGEQVMALESGEQVVALRGLPGAGA